MPNMNILSKKKKIMEHTQQWKKVMSDLPVLILIAVYTETNRKALIKLLLKKSGI